MTPLLLITATMLACDLNNDQRIDGRDIADCLATWQPGDGVTLANIGANFGADWSGMELVVDVHGATWAIADVVERKQSPLYAGKQRVYARVGEFVMGIDER